jgi:hypothetical protein
LSLCLTNWSLYHEDVWGSGRIDPRILDLNINWRWVVTLTAQAFSSRGKGPPVPIGEKTGLDGVERRKILLLTGLELRPLAREIYSQSLYRLTCPGSPTNNIFSVLTHYIKSKISSVSSSYAAQMSEDPVELLHRLFNRWWLVQFHMGWPLVPKERVTATLSRFPWVRVGKIENQVQWEINTCTCSLITTKQRTHPPPVSAYSDQCKTVHGAQNLFCISVVAPDRKFGATTGLVSPNWARTARTMLQYTMDGSLQTWGVAFYNYTDINMCISVFRRQTYEAQTRQ